MFPQKGSQILQGQQLKKKKKKYCMCWFNNIYHEALQHNSGLKNFMFSSGSEWMRSCLKLEHKYLKKK